MHGTARYTAIKVPRSILPRRAEATGGDLEPSMGDNDDVFDEDMEDIFELEEDMVDVGCTAGDDDATAAAAAVCSWSTSSLMVPWWR